MTQRFVQTRGEPFKARNEPVTVQIARISGKGCGDPAAVSGHAECRRRVSALEGFNEAILCQVIDDEVAGSPRTLWLKTT